jgi:6-phosphofructokinase 1
VSHDLEVIGIRQGYKGLFAKDFVELGPRDVANIIQRGGTFLGTARCEEMKMPGGVEAAISSLRERGIDGLITIGGDGTFRGATALAEAGDVKVIGIPGTIDNDVYGSDYTIGFDTAMNTALDAIDKIRDTAGSLQRPFFIEVMGKTRGFLALDVGIAGGAEEILIPEVETSIDAICEAVRHNIATGKKSSIIVVAEGDDAGGAVEIARRVGERLRIEYRICVLGHVQRGGTPTARDRILASKLGSMAVQALMHGKGGYMVGEMCGKESLIPLSDTWRKQKKLNHDLLQLVKVLAT